MKIRTCRGNEMRETCLAELKAQVEEERLMVVLLQEENKGLLKRISLLQEENKGLLLKVLFKTPKPKKAKDSGTS